MHNHPGRPRSVSPRERIASIAAATALAVAGALFVFTAARPRFDSAPGDARSAESVERLTYVPTQTPADRPLALNRLRARAPSSAIPGTRSEDGADAPSPVASSTVATDTVATRGARGTATLPAAEAGAPADALTVGIGRRASRAVPSDSALQAWRADLAAGLASGRIKPPPLTNQEIDEQARARELAAAAARATGSGVPPVQTGGGGISVPLPFGGPSRRQRERERAEYAEAMRILARVQRKADSLLAERRQRRADSLALATDSAATRRAP